MMRARIQLLVVTLALVGSAALAHADPQGLYCQLESSFEECKEPPPAPCSGQALGTAVDVGDDRAKVWIGVEHAPDGGAELIDVALPSPDGGATCLKISSGVAADDPFAPALRVGASPPLPLVRASVLGRSGCAMEYGQLEVACPLLSPGCFVAGTYQLDHASPCGDAAPPKPVAPSRDPAALVARAAAAHGAEAERRWLIAAAATAGDTPLLGLADLYWASGKRAAAATLYSRYVKLEGDRAEARAKARAGATPAAR